jgi:hypothetical protein
VKLDDSRQSLSQKTTREKGNKLKLKLSSTSFDPMPGVREEIEGNVNFIN